MKGLESREVLLVYFALQDIKMICVHLIGLCVVVRGIDLHLAINPSALYRQPVFGGIANLDNGWAVHF